MFKVGSGLPGGRPSVDCGGGRCACGTCMHMCVRVMYKCGECVSVCTCVFECVCTHALVCACVFGCVYMPEGVYMLV